MLLFVCVSFFIETETPYSIPFCGLPFSLSVCSKHLLLPTVCFSAVLLGWCFGEKYTDLLCG